MSNHKNIFQMWNTYNDKMVSLISSISKKKKTIFLPKFVIELKSRTDRTEAFQERFGMTRTSYFTFLRRF